MYYVKFFKYTAIIFYVINSEMQIIIFLQTNPVWSTLINSSSWNIFCEKCYDWIATLHTWIPDRGLVVGMDVVTAALSDSGLSLNRSCDRLWGKKSNFTGFLETNLANFAGNSWKFLEQMLLESDQVCTDLTDVFSEKGRNFATFWKNDECWPMQ